MSVQWNLEWFNYNMRSKKKKLGKCVCSTKYYIVCVYNGSEVSANLFLSFSFHFHFIFTKWNLSGFCTSTQTKIKCIIYQLNRTVRFVIIGFGTFINKLTFSTRTAHNTRPTLPCVISLSSSPSLSVTYLEIIHSLHPQFITNLRVQDDGKVIFEVNNQKRY